MHIFPENVLLASPETYIHLLNLYQEIRATPGQRPALYREIEESVQSLQNRLDANHIRYYITESDGLYHLGRREQLSV